MDKILSVMFEHLSERGDVVLVRQSDWVERAQASNRPVFIIDQISADLDPWGRDRSAFDVYVVTTSTDTSFDIAERLCSELNGASVINNSGWLVRVQITSRAAMAPAVLPPPLSDRLAVTSFTVLATHK